MDSTDKLIADLQRIGMSKPDGFDHPVIFLAKVYAGQIGIERREPNGLGVMETLTFPATIELRAKCAMAVAEFIEAKLKALEVSGAVVVEVPPRIDYRNLPIIDVTPPKAARISGNGNGNGHKRKTAPRIS